MAVAKAAVDLIKNFCETVGKVGRDVVKMAFYLVHKALWSIYQALRETLVYAAYAQPNMEQVQALTSLWKSPGNMAPRFYPVEEYFHDGQLPQTEIVSDYSPLVVPETQPGAVVEQPPVLWAAPYVADSKPDAFLDAPVGKNDMFAGPADKGPIGPTQDPIENSGVDAGEPDRHSFTDLQLDYGGAMANCSAAIKKILAHAAKDGSVLPMQLANYNLDGDRGYGWPCWDVDGASTPLRPSAQMLAANVSAIPWAD